MALLAGLGTAVWLVRGRQAAWAHVGLTLLLAAMFLTPLVWTYLTTTEVDNVNLPGAYEGQSVTALPGADDSRTADTRLLAYLQANTQDSTYLMAVPSSMQGAEYVVATGRPVLYMGGFNGSDPVVDAAGLGQMVAEGDLRYILLRNAGRDRNANQEIEAWVTQNCTAVSQFNGLYVCAAP